MQVLGLSLCDVQVLGLLNKINSYTVVKTLPCCVPDSDFGWAVDFPGVLETESPSPFVRMVAVLSMTRN